MSATEWYQHPNGTINWPSITYSPTATITTLRSYHHFLRDLYLPSSALLEPPSTGWPAVNTTTFADLGKSDEVIHLLKHIPYIANEQEIEGHDAAPNTRFCDFRAPTSLHWAQNGRGEELAQLAQGSHPDIPAHVVGLTAGGRGSAVFLLDTKVGVIYALNTQWEATPLTRRLPPSEQVRKADADPESEGAEDEDEMLDEADDESFRFNPAWPVADFFEMMKERFRRLEWVPVSTRRVVDARGYEGDGEYEGALGLIRRVYEGCGWPGDAFRKEEAAAEVERVVRGAGLDAWAWDYGG